MSEQKPKLVEVRIILKDLEDGSVSIAMECDEEMSLLNRQSEDWTPAQHAGAEVYTRLVRGDVLLPAGQARE